MSDSLTRLVLRAKGELPAIEPLLPSRYAAADTRPLEWGEAVVETESPTSVSPEPVRRAALQSAPLPAPERRMAAPAAAISLPPPAAVPPATAPPATVPLAVEPIAQPAVPESATTSLSGMPRQAQREEPPTSMRPPAAQSWTPSRASEDDLSTPASERFVRRSSPSSPEPAPAPIARPRPPAWAGSPDEPAPAFPPSPSGQAQTASDVPGLAAHSLAARPAAAAGLLGPEVRISIGRVEVHAVPPRQSAARPGPARRPALSLADYLAQRSGKAS